MWMVQSGAKSDFVTVTVGSSGSWAESDFVGFIVGSSGTISLQSNKASLLVMLVLIFDIQYIALPLLPSVTIR